MDVEEFEQFFALIWPRLLSSARRRLEPDEAHEAASATMLTVWTKDLPAPTNREERLKLFGLAFRILEGHVRNARRSLVRRERLLEQLRAHQAAAQAAEPDVCEAVLSQEEARAVSTLLAALSTAEREVVDLVLDGFRVGEIALLLGLPPGAISSRLCRARRSLAQVMERDGEPSR